MGQSSSDMCSPESLAIIEKRGLQLAAVSKILHSLKEILNAGHFPSTDMFPVKNILIPQKIYLGVGPQDHLFPAPLALDFNRYVLAGWKTEESDDERKASLNEFIARFEELPPLLVESLQTVC